MGSLVVAGKLDADLNKAVLKRLTLLNSFLFNLKMARRYDTRTTIFSPEGRLYQVEYAMEAIGHAGTCLGILASDGIVLAAERRSTNKLLDEVFFSEKIYQLNEDMVCSVAGITSDANVLTNELRLISQRYLLQYEESIPCEQLVFPFFMVVGIITMGSNCISLIHLEIMVDGKPPVLEIIVLLLSLS